MKPKLEKSGGMTTVGSARWQRNASSNTKLLSSTSDEGHIRIRCELRQLRIAKILGDYRTSFMLQDYVYGGANPHGGCQEALS